MFEKTVSVTYLSLKDNFICLPKNFGFLKHGSSVKLLYGKNEVGYFSTSNTAHSLDENCIGISSLYAKALGIEDDETVVLMEVPEFPIINSITITPIKPVDYEVLESFSDHIQGTLLTQIRAVYKHQKFVIWIGNNLNITVFVDDVNPVPVGFLGFLTEVHIKKKSESITKSKNVVGSLGNFSLDVKTVKAIANLLSRPSDSHIVDKFLNYKKELILRIVPLDIFPYVKELKGYDKVFNIFVSRRCLKTTWSVENSLNSPVFCSITLIKDDNVFLDTLYGRLIAFEDIFDDCTVHKNDVYVSKPVFDKFMCQIGAKLKVEYVEKRPSVTEIEVFTKRKFLRNFQQVFKQFMADCSDVVTVLNSDIPINIDNKVTCTLKFNNSSKFVVVDDDLVRNCKYKFSEDSNAISEDKKDDIKKKNACYLLEIGNYSDIINNVIKSFSRGGSCFENTLISGRPGSGKSSVLIEIANKLESYPNLVFTKTLECKSVKGKTMESLHKLFDGIFSELVLHQPSVLLLDDLHILCENVKGEQQLQSLYFSRISEMLYNFFKVMSRQNEIGICATTESLESLNTNMYTSRGSYLYKSLHTVNDFTKGDRLSLLKFLFKDCDIVDINLEELSLKTEGFVVHDIVDFYNKAMFESFKKENCNLGVIKITQDYCNKAFDNTCVLSLENVNLHSPGDKDFSDIGGLQQVKKTLLESLLWPAKFPKLFANAPLRLQTGLLLYGPPGTGKTLIAAAAAKHCELRLISVKGPELLSKYIGASEEAVRNVFQTAQSVKPCMIFFDEFDSLAPRRGNDTTGVSDRVVNQLLTQLDGVESLTGVYVMAATSRPDLLDPALLRPGRLDKQLYCSLPNKRERLDTLCILSRNLELSEDVDLETLAGKTEWYSGADLQSLMYTAQVSTVAGLFENGQVNEEFAKSKVTQQHLEEALAKTKPSLTQQDRARYQRIYAKFQSGSSTEDYEAGTKATFA